MIIIRALVIGCGVLYIIVRAPGHVKVGQAEPFQVNTLLSTHLNIFVAVSFHGITRSKQLAPERKLQHSRGGRIIFMGSKLGKLSQKS